MSSLAFANGGSENTLAFASEHYWSGACKYQQTTPSGNTAAFEDFACNCVTEDPAVAASFVQGTYRENWQASGRLHCGAKHGSHTVRFAACGTVIRAANQIMESVDLGTVNDGAHDWSLLQPCVMRARKSQTSTALAIFGAGTG